jgi:hypothetical protein
VTELLLLSNSRAPGMAFLEHDLSFLLGTAPRFDAGR